jgi:hypothetical protein
MTSMVLFNNIWSHHDIAEILLKLALNTNQSINQSLIFDVLGDMAAIEARSHSDVSVLEYCLWHDHDHDDPQKIWKERFNSWKP